MEEQFPERNIGASIIDNGFISLLRQLRYHCNPDHNKFSSLSNTTVVAIFPNVCLWPSSLCSNLAGIDPKKLYRAIFICQYGLCCCIGPRFCSTVLLKFEQLANFFWANGLPPPRAKNFPYAYVYINAVFAPDIDCVRSYSKHLYENKGRYKSCVLCFEINGLYAFLSFHFAVTSVYISIKW